MAKDSKIWIDPKIAHIVPKGATLQDIWKDDGISEKVDSFLLREGYSHVPTMGDDNHVDQLCSDENGIAGFISGNDWGNVEDVLKEQLDKHGLQSEFVEFMGCAYFKIVQKE